MKISSLFGVIVASLVLFRSGHATGTGNISRSEPSDPISLYAFSGFVYNIDGCVDTATVHTAMKDMFVTYKARVFITFGGCDQANYFSDLIGYAGSVGIKIIPLVWFGYDGGTQWKTRADVITKAVIANPAPVYGVAYGDEPLYDWAAGDPQDLANAINSMKSQFKSAGLNIPVSISEMAYGYQQAMPGAQAVIDAVDMAMINTFPYFAQDAHEGGSSYSWNDFVNDINYFLQHFNGKPLLVTQTGWPSNEDVWPPNSPDAVVSIQSEKDYFDLLDKNCSYFKSLNMGWMARAYDDNGLPGWGVLDYNEKPKFTFAPKLSC